MVVQLTKHVQKSVDMVMASTDLDQIQQFHTNGLRKGEMALVAACEHRKLELGQVKRRTKSTLRETDVIPKGSATPLPYEGRRAEEIVTFLRAREGRSIDLFLPIAGRQSIPMRLTLDEQDAITVLHLATRQKPEAEYYSSMSAIRGVYIDAGAGWNTWDTVVDADKRTISQLVGPSAVEADGDE